MCALMHTTRPIIPRWWRRLLDAIRPAASGAEPQVRVVHWGGRLAPGHVVVKAGLPIRLVFESSAAEFLIIPTLGWVTTLGWAPRSSVDLGPFAAGSYDFSSLDGALRGRLVVVP